MKSLENNFGNENEDIILDQKKSEGIADKIKNLKKNAGNYIRPLVAAAVIAVGSGQALEASANKIPTEGNPSNLQKNEKQQLKNPAQDAEKIIVFENPNILSRVLNNDIKGARFVFEQKIFDKSDKEREFLHLGIDKIISEHIYKVFHSKNTHLMKELANNVDLDEIGIKNLSNLPKMISRSPEMQARFIEHIDKNFHVNSNLQDASNDASKFVSSGLMDKEDAEKYLSSLVNGSVEDTFASKEMQDTFIKDIKNHYNYYINHEDVAKNTAEYAKTFVDKKLLTKETLEKLFASKEMQDIFSKSIKNHYNYYINHEDVAKHTAEYAKTFVDKKLITKETFEDFFASKEMQDIFSKSIKNHYNYYINHEDVAKHTAEYAETFVEYKLMKRDSAKKILDNLGKTDSAKSK